ALPGAAGPSMPDYACTRSIGSRLPISRLDRRRPYAFARSLVETGRNWLAVQPLPAYLLVRNLQEYVPQDQRRPDRPATPCRDGEQRHAVQCPVRVRRAGGPSYGPLSFRRQPLAELFQPALPHSRQPPRNFGLRGSAPIVFQPPRPA